MKLSQFLQGLSYAEFSNLAVGEQGSGEIQERRIPSVVASVNAALLRIYSKFLQYHRTVHVKKLPGKTLYVLDSAHAESTGAVDPYIMDADDPFTNDIIKIVEVTYRVQPTTAVLDNGKECLWQPPMIRVPNSISVPAEIPDGQIIVVRYRASHPVVSLDDDTFLQCPPAAFEALSAYVAYKEYMGMNTETSTAKGMEYLNLYNSVCAELVDRDTIGITEVGNDPDNRFFKRGFV